MRLPDSPANPARLLKPNSTIETPRTHGRADTLVCPYKTLKDGETVITDADPVQMRHSVTPGYASGVGVNSGSGAGVCASAAPRSRTGKMPLLGT